MPVRRLSITVESIREQILKGNSPRTQYEPDKLLERLSNNGYIGRTSFVEHTVIIVFTDIVGSSRLWDTHNKDMIPVLKKHNLLIETVAKNCEGVIIKSIGDSYMLYFTEPEHAVIFGIIVQTILRTYLKEPIPINVRIGITKGIAYGISSWWQDSVLFDFHGPAINVASRIETYVANAGGIAVNHEIFNHEGTMKIINFYLNVQQVVYLNKVLLKEKVKRKQITKKDRNGNYYQLATSKSSDKKGDDIIFRDSEKLNGVGDMVVYKCTFKEFPESVFQSIATNMNSHFYT